MEGMEDKLNAILGNPDLMGQIMSMANSLATSPPPAQEEPKSEFDPAMIQGILSIAGKMGADPQQKALLNALKPYLSSSRIEKLEKAMRAAKLANAASSALRNGGLSFLTGR